MNLHHQDDRASFPVHLMRHYSNWAEHRKLAKALLNLSAPQGDRRPPPAPRRLSAKLTYDDRASIVRDYEAGTATIVALSHRFQISDYSVRVVLRQAGVPARRRTITQEQVDQVLELWTESGLGVEAIALQTRMGHANVRLIVAGRMRRPRGN